MHSRNKKISPRIKRKVRLLKTAARGAAHFALLDKYKRRRRLLIATQSLGFALVLILSVILQTYLQVHPPTYALDATVKNLIGESRDDTAQYLKDDSQADAFTFSVPKSSDGDGDASEHTGRVDDAYEASLAKDAREGILVTEKESNIGVSLKPSFRTYEARKVEGDHIVYLASGGVKLVYTLKYNGLKEDIIVPSYRGDKLEYGFELSLPSGVEARLDERGNIGIYSSDPTLFGEISFGSDEDRTRVEKARENGEKNHLVATIPYPVVKDANGREYSDKATFSLGEKRQKQSEQAADPKLPAEVLEKLKASTTKNVYDLVIASQGLKDLTYPISIDPTMQVPGSGDFDGVNMESGTEIDTTDNLIKRGGLTGGIVTTGTTTRGAGGVSRYCIGSVAYNGFMYITGGYTVTGQTTYNTSYYSPIDSNGDITEVYTQGPNLPNTIHCHSMVARDGYIYTLGGYRGAATGDVWRSKLRQDGSMGNWEVLTGMGNAIYLGDAEIIGDYVYVAGSNSAVRYAQFLADGTFGTWASATASFPAAAGYGIQLDSYNGMLYFSGGHMGSGGASSSFNGTYYARPASDGNISAWTTGPNLNQARGSHTMEALDGYVYVAGGCGNRDALGGCNLHINAIEYAQVNADGSIGSWKFTGAGIGTIWAGSTVYNGIWYNVGGCTSASNIATFGNGQCNAAGNQTLGTWRVWPKPAGELHNSAWTGTNGIPASRAYFASATYNGFIYVAGGYDTAYANATATVYYGSIASNGTVTWSTDADSPLPNVRAGPTMAAHNGYMYLIGGRNYDGTVLHNTVHYAPINSNGSLGAWSSAGTGFTTARHLHQGVIYNGYLYVVGGCSVADCGVTPNSRLNSVQYAKLAAGGALENSGSCTPWCTSATGFNAARDAFAVHAYNGYLYVVGGADDGGTGYQNDTQFAALNTDGSLVSDNPGCVGTAMWCASTSFTTPRWGLASSIYNGYMYVMGGQSSGGQLSDIQYAKIGNDGTIGTWNTATSAFTTVRTAHGAAIVNGYAYIFGGDAGGTIQNSTQFQTINNGGSGSISSWTAATGTSQRFGHAAVAYNGYLYLGGGCQFVVLSSCTSQLTNIVRASISANGNLGTFTDTTTGMPAGYMIFYAMVAHGGYLYIAGGVVGSNSVTNAYSIPLNATTGDTIGSWTATAPAVGSLPSLNTARALPGSVVYNGHWYIAGGCTSATCVAGTATNTIEVADFTANGGLSAWNQAGNQAFTTARAAFGFVAYNNYLFVFGGCTINSCSSGSLSDVQSTPLTNSNGLVDNPWTTQGVSGSFVIPGGGVYGAYNGYLYTVGGIASGAEQRTTVAPILPNGGVGQWQTAGASLGENRIYSAGTLYAGKIYMTGGVEDATNLTPTVVAADYATLQSIPRVGSFSRRYDFGAGVRPTKLITRGTKQGGAIVGVNYSNNISCSTAVYDQPQTIADTGYAGSNAQTLTLGTSRTLAQCLFLRYTIDETGSAVFPDSGNETTVSDFDLYFTANPGQRLRGGRTFTNGVDRGLDAQPQ